MAPHSSLYADSWRTKAFWARVLTWAVSICSNMLRWDLLSRTPQRPRIATNQVVMKWLFPRLIWDGRINLILTIFTERSNSSVRQRDFWASMAFQAGPWGDGLILAILCPKRPD